MQRTEVIFAFMMMLTLTCNLNAQEASPEKIAEPKTVIEQITEDGDVEDVEDAVDTLIEDGGDTGTIDEFNERVDDEDVDADDEDSDDEEFETGPVTVRVNENGELVGQATADVGGDWVPVEANVALVANGVLLKKIVAKQDGSFAFPNIAPGDYNLCGAASSYCGQQAVTVVSESNCSDNVGLRLSQSEQSCCYSQLGSAPAATFAGGSGAGGFSSGGFAGGGGGFAGGGGSFATGGGAASGVSGVRRLLVVGGIATAIAVSTSDDDDDASPTN